MEKDNLKTLLDYLLFLQPQIGKLIDIEDITMNQTELAELERLAEIGRATEKLFKAYAWVETIGEDFKSVEELLNWAKED